MTELARARGGTAPPVTASTSGAGDGTDDRLAHLMDVAAALWPAPASATLGQPRRRGEDLVEEFFVLPSARRPRLLTPTGRRAAAAVARQAGVGRSRPDRLRATVLAWGLRAGLGPAISRRRLRVVGPAGNSTASLLSHVGSILGRDVLMGLPLSPPRANRKPVLHLVDPAGRSLAYVKLGVDRLTDDLVRREAGALRTLAAVRATGFTVPRLLHAGQWGGHELLVQSALPSWRPPRALPEERLVGAVRALSSPGRTDGRPLPESEYWTHLTAVIAALPATPSAIRLHGVVRRLVAVARDVRVPLGASHGDWAPWNMACVEDGLLVWDWERFRPAVPVGFDLLHHRLQTDLVVRGEDPAAAATRLIDGAVIRLAPLGHRPRVARTVAVLYLADLAARYLTDRQLEAGARLGDVAAYLLPACDRGLALIEGERP